jgi:hypothetical protein
VEPRSLSFARAVRALDDDELEDPLLGVEKRFRAVDSVELEPLEAEVPLVDALEEDEEDAVEEADADEEACDELDELLELEEDDELPAPEDWKVGALEIALTLARAADGSELVGLRRVPRNCGTSRAA